MLAILDVCLFYSMTSSNVDRSISSHSTVSRTSSKINHRRGGSETESELQDAASTSDTVLRDYMDSVSISINDFQVLSYDMSENTFLDLSLIHFDFKLPKKLNAEELKQFATLLNQWLKMGLPFEDFCNKVVQLYGPNRKNLLYGTS